MRTRRLTPVFTPVLMPVLTGLFLSIPGVAAAHFDLVMPPPADSALDGGKGAPPCGPTAASNVVTPVQGGHALTVSLTETVMHPGHYRLALSINSRSELPADPTAVVDSSGNSVSAPSENPAVFPVLADDLFDHTSGAAPIPWQTTVTLPNVTCTKCTLQVIEFMADHGANPGGGYFYHHCADLMITADPSLPAFTPPAGGADAGQTGSSGGGGCSIRGARAGRAAPLAIALLTVSFAVTGLRRRRRGRRR